MIETKGLRKTFRSRAGRETKVVEAVVGVDLKVDAGEIFGFLGPNGAGKTTTLRMLATLLDPDDGQATVAGVDLRKHPGEVRKRIGYVAQGGSTWDESTAREELVLQARMYGLSKAEAQAARGQVAGGLPADRVRRPQVQDLLRRPAPPGGHRARHHPRAEARLPRRADHRPRPAEPRTHVGRDPSAA
jgi:ABC-type multidrug transport system ATPase subunit